MRRAPGATPSFAVAVLACFATLTISGCAHPVFHATGGAKFPAREPTCQFQLLGTHPGPSYVEIGQLTIEGDRSFGAGRYEDPQAFANNVRAEVCAVGGDALATEVNGEGDIVRGIIFRKAGEVAPLPGSAPASVQLDGCDPICSPGFRCVSHACTPQCNPVCTDKEKCGNDRLCHPRDTSK